MATTDRKIDGTNPHTISFILDAETITTKFECSAGSAGACHVYKSCDHEWSCDHEPELQTECWMQSWFDSLMPVEELHADNEPYLLAKVPISYETMFDDGLTWSVDRTPPLPAHPPLPIFSEATP